VEAAGGPGNFETKMKFSEYFYSSPARLIGAMEEQEEQAPTLDPCTVTFRGVTVSVPQEALPAGSAPPPASGATSDTTGRLVWECCAVFLKWLGSDANLLRLTGGAATGLALLDLSCGAGLVPLALRAALPPPALRCVRCWETQQQLPHLLRSLAPVLGAGSGGGSDGDACLVQAYYWGQDPAPLLKESQRPSAALCSDVLYIALRDGLARQLSCTLRHLAGQLSSGGAVLFGFEERLLREEEDFMRALAQPLAAAAEGSGQFWEGAAPALAVEELPKTETLLAREETLGAPDLFWEPPNIRLFLLRRLPGSLPMAATA
jgi:hypothetical protein